MEKNADGKLAITRVELRPKITWSGDRRPSPEELENGPSVLDAVAALVMVDVVGLSVSKKQDQAVAMGSVHQPRENMPDRGALRRISVPTHFDE